MAAIGEDSSGQEMKKKTRSKSPMCTLSQNGYGACSIRFGSISGDICQVQFLPAAIFSYCCHFAAWQQAACLSPAC